MIKFACKCGKQIRVRDEAAGKRVRCPDCGRTLVVPPTPVSRAPGGERPQAGAC